MCGADVDLIARLHYLDQGPPETPCRSTDPLMKSLTGPIWWLIKIGSAQQLANKRHAEYSEHEPAHEALTDDEITRDALEWNTAKSKG